MNEAANEWLSRNRGQRARSQGLGEACCVSPMQTSKRGAAGGVAGGSLHRGVQQEGWPGEMPWRWTPAPRARPPRALAQRFLFQGGAASRPVRERPFHVRPLDRLPHPDPRSRHCSIRHTSRPRSLPPRPVWVWSPPHHHHSTADTQALGPSSPGSRCRCLCPHGGPGHPTHLLSRSASSSNKTKLTIRSRDVNTN